MTVSAVEVTVFGPHQFVRTAGPPTSYGETFVAVAGDGVLVVTNGDTDGKHRISSGVVLLNGEAVTGTSSFNQRVGELVFPVSLGEANTIQVTLQSKLGSFLTLTVVQDIPIVLEAGPAGVAIEDPDRLLVALPLLNEGSATAEDVQITSAFLESTDLLAPTSFPVGIGDIAADDRGVFEAAFASTGLVSGDAYLLHVSGSFASGPLRLDFALERPIAVPARAPGSAPLSFVTATPSTVTGAPFTPSPEPSEVPEGYNEEPLPPIPTGQPRGTMVPTTGGSLLQGGTISELPQPEAAAAPAMIAKTLSDPVLFFRSVGYGSGSGTWLDPNGATAGDIVIGSYNGPVAFSTDGGANFTHHNVSSIFPNKDANGNLIDGGFGCDQVIVYVPQYDRFVWLMQFRRGLLPGDDPDEPTGPNRYRLATASSAQFIASGGTVWTTYWDLTCALFGFEDHIWMDYPDLAVGANYLYLSADVVGGGGLFVARIPLADIDGEGVINIGFTDPALGGLVLGSHLVHDIGETAYWAGHNGNGAVRIFSMSESDDYYAWRDLALIDSWPNSDLSSITPTGRDWLAFGFPGFRIIGGTRRLATHFLEDNSVVQSDELWLAWGAGQGGGFPEPHIQLLTVDMFDETVTGQRQIWSDEVAFSYPALALNNQSEIGVALAFGGNDAHSNFAVGIWGDYVVYYPELADASKSRFGDYFGIRPFWPEQGLFAAFGLWYAQANPSTADDCDPSNECLTVRHHIVFGRASALEPPSPPPS